APGRRHDDSARDPDLRPEHPRPLRCTTAGGRAVGGRGRAGRAPGPGRGGGAALMSLYRTTGGRSIGVVALLIGGVVGYLIGHAGQSSPTLTDGLANVQKAIRPAVDGIELITV